jgi:predicted outer membrane repeat protein
MKKSLHFLVYLLLYSFSFGQTTWFVSPGCNNPTGRSWATAFTDIQSAVDAASAGDDILVGYNPAAVTTYTLASQITVANKSLRITSARINQDNTYEDAEYNSVRCVLDGNDVCRIFEISGSSGSSTETMIIRGFKMTNGFADSQNGGGAIKCDGALTITNNRFVSNLADDGASKGGAIVHGGTGCVITNNLFYQNVATNSSTTSHTGQGGAIYGARNSSITRNIFKENVCSVNQSSALGGSKGGAIYALQDCSIINNDFDGNYTSGQAYTTNPPDHGEAIYAYDGTPVIMNNTFTNHQHTAGGLYAVERQPSSNIDVKNCLFYNNSGDGGPHTTLIDCITGQDPLFTDPANNDYTLQANSPCIDAGNAATPVPQGGAPIVDIGAYEFINQNVNNVACGLNWVGNFQQGCALAAISQNGNGIIQFQQVLSDPPNIPAGARHIEKYWDISDVQNDNVKVRLYYTAEARADFTGTPTIYHFDTGQNKWIDLPTQPEVADGNSFYVETTNFRAGFSNVTVGDDNAPLPVELFSFSANSQNGKVILNWQTATETDNFGFEVQRRSAGNNNASFEKLGFVAGSGNSNSVKEYSFTDDTPLSGKIEYRLKQIDSDGRFEYSKIIEIEINAPKEFELMQNYPNPFNPVTTIKFGLPEKCDVKFLVYNLLGEKVVELSYEGMEAGYHKIEFDASRLSSGVYLYSVVSLNHKALKKMVVLK